MKTILVTGAHGFIGANLVEVLRKQEGLNVREYGRTNTMQDLSGYLAEADVIVHLAAANRPDSPCEYETVNAGLTQYICDQLGRLGRSPKVVFSSSIQAELDTPYGISKAHAEQALLTYANSTGAEVIIYRLQNVFGKWARPNYNSVVATFCHNIARNLPITITDPRRELALVYIDDVVRALAANVSVETIQSGGRFGVVAPVYHQSLGGLAERIRSFASVRSSMVVPDFNDEFTRCLYATYLSYLPTTDFAYPLSVKSDQRGELAEFLKSSSGGQIFVSRTRPGFTRGNHYHHTKTEKFLVLQGKALVRFRHVLSQEVITYPVSGEDLRVIDIPPGFTHSIENVGEIDMVVLFWASEVFDPSFPDTFYCEV